MESSRSVRVLYAEDVRFEISGQISIIGVFPDGITAANFPLVIPKFAIYVEIGIPVDEPVKTLNFSITTDDGVSLVDQNFPPEVLSQQETLSKTLDFEGLTEKKIGIRTQFFLTPLHLERPTILRAKITTEKGDVFAQALKVRQGSPAIQVMQVAQ
ncbi:hypothetical protein PPN31119_03174 [Pandoraea pnomenusa]|uniref:DUF1833 domain-containing protein n=2 Tax=Pandoraea pnomenusa TaxID=93220 RepID=A0ABY6WLX9_9BURK|nr:hypothetical protein PPN31119_03174 [Pandoraea pnomenusa]